MLSENDRQTDRNTIKDRQLDRASDLDRETGETEGPTGIETEKGLRQQISKQRQRQVGGLAETYSADKERKKIKQRRETEVTQCLIT